MLDQYADNGIISQTHKKMTCMRKKFRCVLRDSQKLLSPEDDVETCTGILAKLQVESKH
jgi:hypothetical protein